MSLNDTATSALAEIGAVLDRALPNAVTQMAEPILAARRIACYGVGREGLMMKALAMRLYHLGCDAHVIGDMTTPPIGPGDLLIVSAGPGYFSTVEGLMRTAEAAGATRLLVTATPDGPVATLADHVALIPAQTMADDLAAPSSTLPMGSLYEGALFVAFEVLILHLRARMDVAPDDMRARHTNME